MKSLKVKIIMMLLILAVIASPVFAQEVISVEKAHLNIEMLRTQFNELILENPNYFGNLSKIDLMEKYPTKEFPVVCPMIYNTKYEELLCVGLYPEDNVLEAVIEVKLPFGFKGGLCSKGSKEYVGFYIDYHDGSGFVSVGAPAEVSVHNLKFIDGGHVFYAVRKCFIPKQLLTCNKPQIVKVRAILSWEKLPSGPNYKPVWGNVLERWVQIKPKKKLIIKPVFTGELVFQTPAMGVTEVIKEPPKGPIPPPPEPLVPVEKYVIMGDVNEIKEIIGKTIRAEDEIREKRKVEPYRLDFKKHITKNPNYFGSISESKQQSVVMEAFAKLPPKTIEDMLPKLAINPNLLIPVQTFLNKTKYEQLTCVGLYPEDDLLEAVIEVKLPYGFNGDLCTLGSMEYVAFYIDWGVGFQYITTATVGVHDIPFVAKKHLFYAVKAKIPKKLLKLKLCKIENIVKVKAILSWNQDPTPYGHKFKPTWGNVLTRNIQIRPKNGLSAKCEIDIVNGVHVDHINNGLAVKPGSTYPYEYDRPFGGIIACMGDINISGAPYYRFLYRPSGGTSWKEITDSRRTKNPSMIGPIYVDRFPDAQGWFSRDQYLKDKIDEYDLAALVHWRSYGKDGMYDLRLELGDAAKNAIPGQTYDIELVLDNTRPKLYWFGGSPLPTQGVAVKDIHGNYKKCDIFDGNEPIRIFGNFEDKHFKQCSLLVFGGNIKASGEPLITIQYDSGHTAIDDEGIILAVDYGPGGELHAFDLCPIPQIGGKIKCAYGIELRIWDRAIVGYIEKNDYAFDIYHHRTDAFVTFDWDPAGCP